MGIHKHSKLFAMFAPDPKFRRNAQTILGGKAESLVVKAQAETQAWVQIPPAVPEPSPEMFRPSLIIVQGKAHLLSMIKPLPPSLVVEHTWIRYCCQSRHF